MKINYVSFVGDNKMQSLNKTHETIIEKLSSLNTNDDGGFEFCTTYAQMLKTLSSSFTDSGITVLLIDVAQFNKTKSLLFKAMSIKCVRNDEVISKIKSHENLSFLNEKQITAHSALPINAQAFVTNDGLFSGFGIESNSQKMVVLPIDETRVDEDLLEEVYDYLNDGSALIEESDEVENETQTDSISQQEQVDEVAEDIPISNRHEVDETEQNQPLFGPGGVDDLVAETLTNIVYSQIKIAFGVQEDNLIVDEYFRTKIVFRNTGLFTIVNVNKTTFEDDERKVKANISQIARSSMLNANASIGMAVSEVMTDEDGKAFVLSAMCDAKKTNIYKVYALPGEEDQDVIICAIGNMFGVLNDRVKVFNERIRQKNSDSSEKQKKQKKQKNSKPKEQKSKVPFIVLIVILVILLAAIAYVAYNYFHNGVGVYELIEKIKNLVFPQT